MKHTADRYNYDPELQCCWLSWTAEKPGRLVLRVPGLQTTNKTATVAVGRRLMPTVREIYVVNGVGLEVIYRNDGAKWMAICQLNTYRHHTTTKGA